MGSPQAGKLFLQALTGSGLESSSLQQNSMFDTVALQTIKDIEASEGQVTCLIPVEERVQNRYGTLHGGCIGLNPCLSRKTACSPCMHIGTCQTVSVEPGPMSWLGFACAAHPVPCFHACTVFPYAVRHTCE